MSAIKRFYLSEKYIVFILSLVLFGVGILVGVTEVIIYTLSFLILLEIVRTIYEYVVDEDHVLYMHLMIDSGVLFGLRELYVAWLMLKTEFDEGLAIMGVSLVAIAVLLVFKQMVVKNLPLKEDRKGLI